MPKGKGKGAKINFGKGRVDDELDAYDYAEEDAAYQRWEETQVKENRLETSVSKVEDLWEKPFVPLAERQAQEAAAKAKAEKEAKEKAEKEAREAKEAKEAEEAEWDRKEVELEQFDNWEDAMDALDAHMSRQEEIKAEGAPAPKNEPSKLKR